MTADINKGPFFGQRHLQVFLLFCAIVVNYLPKLNASVAVVAMTSANTTNPNFPEYYWNDLEKGYIQSSFYWGYVLTQFPGGYFCRRFGAKSTLLISTFVSSMLGLLPPFCVSWGGWKIYCAIRIIQGLLQGALFPAFYANLAVWCPINEQTRLGALANMGMDVGTLLAMLVSGIIASSDLGWPGLFYVTGCAGLVWCVAWHFFAANQPSESRYISTEELNYINAGKNITKEVEGAEMQQRKDATEIKHKKSVPWRAILTSLPVWASVLMRSAYAWGFNTLQNHLPSYMKGVHKMDISSNALFSALPYLALLTMSSVFLIASDVLLTRKILSLTVLRKSFNTVSYWIPALGLIAVGFLGADQTTLVIVLITAIVGLTAGGTIGHAINVIDLTENYVDIIMGIINTVSNCVPILTPLVAGLIVTDDSDRKQWQIVFAIAAAVYGLGNLFYLIFGRMKIQPWDDLNFGQSQHAADTELGNPTITT